MQLREIKQKINLTRNIARSTKALELVAIMKMKRAQREVFASREFALSVLAVLRILLQEEKDYFKRRKGEKEKFLAVVISSDRGFCGGFNQKILKFAHQKIKQLSRKAQTDVLALGKKGAFYFQKRGFLVKSKLTGIGDIRDFERAREIGDLIWHYFQEENYSRAFLFYTDFSSVFLQTPKSFQILPPSIEDIKGMLSDFLSSKKISQFLTPKEKRYPYLFEPSKEEFFSDLLPQLVSYELYHAILEANASEHSSRMIAMKNASQNAERLIENLTSEYNKARQAQITSEVAEISSAKEALEEK